MRSGSKRPADYLSELPPLPESRLKVRWRRRRVAAVRACLRRAAALTLCPRPCASPGLRWCLQGDELLEKELARVAAKGDMAGMDTARYNLPPPPEGQRGDPAAWRAALDNAHAQLEHQYNRCGARAAGQQPPHCRCSCWAARQRRARPPQARGSAPPRRRRFKPAVGNAAKPSSPRLPSLATPLPPRPFSLVNLELLLKFGPDAWRMHNEALASFVARLQEQLAAVRRQARRRAGGRAGWRLWAAALLRRMCRGAACRRALRIGARLRTRSTRRPCISPLPPRLPSRRARACSHGPACCPPGPAPRLQVDDLNRERKLQQHAAGGELAKLEAEYLGLVTKNGEIEAACRSLEAEVAAMRDALPKGAAAGAPQENGVEGGGGGGGGGGGEAMKE